MGAKLTTLSNPTLGDLWRGCQGKRFPRDAPNRLLQGAVAIQFAMNQAGLDAYRFGRRYVETEEAKRISSGSNLLYKWLGMKTMPSRQKIANIDRNFPGTLPLYDHPLFTLLDARAITIGEISALLARYKSAKRETDWDYPDDSENWAASKYVNVIGRDNTNVLRHWRGIEGFTVILGLVREAEAYGDSAKHIMRVTDLYRCLPTVLAIPWFKKYSEMVCYCVQEIHRRDFISSAIVKVDWHQIHELSCDDVQSTLTSWYDSDGFWRRREGQRLDVVSVSYPSSPPFLSNPLGE